MKTFKESSKPIKTNKVTKPAEIKINIQIKPEYTQEEISQKANELYLQRIERGEHGTAEQDWINAEKALEESED
jgi:hypothetical protein